MKNILLLFSLLFVIKANAQYTVVPVGAATQTTVERGGQAAESLLAAPVIDTGASNSYAPTQYRKKGRILVTTGGDFYYNNGTLYRKVLSQADSDYIQSLVPPADTSILATKYYVDNNYVPNARTVNGHALSSNVTVTKSDVGLSNVDNTSDVNKPVSTAQQTAIDAKVANAINSGVTTIAPAQDAVFTALAGKQASLGFTPENVANKSNVTGFGTSTSTYHNERSTKVFVDSSSYGKKGYRVIIMGQSNAIGRADTGDLHLPPLNGIPDNIRGQFNRVWMADLYGTYYPLQLSVTNRGYTGNNAFGVEMAIAYRWLLTHPSGELFLNKYTIDGSPISNFLPGTNFYINTLGGGYVNSTAWLKNNGYDVIDAGIVWLQGESDYTDTWPVYYNKLNTLFTGLINDGYISNKTRIILSGISTHSTLFGTGVDTAFMLFGYPNYSYSRYIDNKTSTDLNSDSLHWNGRGIFKIGYEATRLIFGADTMTPENHIPRLPYQVTAAGIGLGNVENTALSTWAGSTNITTVGTVSTGTWNASTIGVTKGGTGVTSTTAYSVITGGITSTGAFQSVSGVGTAGQVLTSNGASALPTWQTASGGATLAQVDSMAGFGLPNLPHRKGKYVFVQTSGSGDLDLYTVPAGKKAFVSAIRFYNKALSSSTAYGEVKIGGTYYRLTNNQAVLTEAKSLQSVFFVFEGGQSFSVNCTASGMNVYAEILEFDSSANIKSAYITGCATGDQTLYTCPSGKTASVLGGLPIIYNGGAALNFVADAGGVRTVSFNAVPSGGSPSGANQLETAFATTASGRAALTDPISLGAGDFININVSTGNAAQIAWVNVVYWND